MLWSHEISSLVYRIIYIYTLSDYDNCLGVTRCLRLIKGDPPYIYPYIPHKLIAQDFSYLDVSPRHKNIQSTILLSHAPWPCLLLLLFVCLVFVCMKDGTQDLRQVR